jgi:hypothetical protein
VFLSDDSNFKAFLIIYLVNSQSPETFIGTDKIGYQALSEHNSRKTLMILFFIGFLFFDKF